MLLTVAWRSRHWVDRNCVARILSAWVDLRDCFLLKVKCTQHVMCLAKWTQRLIHYAMKHLIRLLCVQGLGVMLMKRLYFSAAIQWALVMLSVCCTRLHNRLFKIGVLNVFNHVAQLMNKQSPWPTECTTSPMRQLLHIHTAEKNQHLIMQRVLLSMRRLSLFVVRKQRYSRLNTWLCRDQACFQILFSLQQERYFRGLSR